MAEGFVSIPNSTAIPLTSGSVFTGVFEEVKDFGCVIVTVIADEASAIDGLQLQWSTNGSDVDLTDTYTLAANVGQSICPTIKARYFRLIFTNGGTNQTLFRLQTLYTYSSNSDKFEIDGVVNLGLGNTLIGWVKLTDGVTIASVRDLTNANALDVAIVDINGDQITSFGGGVQYTEGDTDATITGTAVMWEDSVDTLTPVSVTKPLPISDAGGSLTVDGTVAVSAIAGALPAGSNNIGDVDVLTLPAGTVAGSSSLPAGTNNIGDVDVLTLPSIPAGTNNIGDVDVLTLPSIPAGNNNIGDVDVASITAGDNVIGRVKITDGTLVATVRDTGSSDSLNVAIVDGAGNQITSFGGGTQYTEGDTDTTITGTAMLWEDAGNTLMPISAAKPLPVGDGGGSLTVDGTVSITGTVTVDTELPAAAALAAGMANPTTPLIGACVVGHDYGNGLWYPCKVTRDGSSAYLDTIPRFEDNSGTWRSWAASNAIAEGQSGAYAPAVGIHMFDATTNLYKIRQANAVDNTAGAGALASGGMVYSTPDTKWFRHEGNARGEARVVEFTPAVPSGTLTRPGNTTTYTTNDELTDTGGAILAISGCARYNGGGGYIEAITVIGSVNAATDPLLDIFVFDTTSTPAADNAAFAPSDAVMQTCLVAKSLGTGFPGDTATSGNLVWQLSGLRIPFVCGAASTSLFVRFAVRNGYVPPSNSETFRVRLHVFQS